MVFRYLCRKTKTISLKKCIEKYITSNTLKHSGDDCISRWMLPFLLTIMSQLFFHKTSLNPKNITNTLIHFPNTRNSFIHCNPIIVFNGSSLNKSVFPPVTPISVISFVKIRFIKQKTTIFLSFSPFCNHSSVKSISVIVLTPCYLRWGIKYPYIIFCLLSIVPWLITCL